MRLARVIKGRPNTFRVIAAALLLATVAAGARPYAPPEKESLPNFGQVNENLYRGAQPREGGVEKLHALGIRTIVSLRSENEQTRDEEKEAAAAGMKYIREPLAGLGRPSDEQVARVLAIINDPANQPVFIHCNHGKDRTGTVIACYRISHDGWTLEQAMKEAKHYGMSWIQFKMKNFIKDYYRDHRGNPKTAVSVPDFTPYVLASRGQ